MTLQQQIIKALGAKPQINAEEEIRRSVDFLKSYLQTYPFIKSLVLGISGVQIGPGATAFTRTCGASASAKQSIIATTPALAAE